MFHTKGYTGKQISNKKCENNFLICSAYQEKMIFSWGFLNEIFSRLVKAYDHIVDKWIQMPSMISGTHFSISCFL